MPNISKSKGNQTMKFGQIVKYIVQIFFSKKHTQHLVEKLVLDSFLKNQNWAYLWINSLNFYTVCFYCRSKSRTTKIFLPHFNFYLIQSFFKTKRGLKLFSLPHFLYEFWKKIFLKLHSGNWWNWIVWFILLTLDTELYVYCNGLLPSSWHIFWNLALLSSRFPTWPKKSGRKI